MNGIVLANNLISLYIFWELVGVSSYLLIAHWFEKPSAAAAGQKGIPNEQSRGYRFLYRYYAHVYRHWFF